MENDIQDAEIIQSSPLPQKKQQLLSFYEALSKASEGKRITKLEWNNKNIFGFFSEDERLRINLPEKVCDWIVSQGDLKGNDWLVLEEVN